MFRKLISAGALAILMAASSADAAVTVITYLDASSGSHNGAYALDASSNAYPLSVICGATTATLGATVAECAIVNASGQLSVAGPVTNAGTFPVQLNATPSLANGNGVVPTQGGAVLSATNGAFQNILQGNAVLSVANPGFASISDGTTKATVNAGDSGLTVHVANTNANGQALAAASSPVVLPAAQITADPCALGVKTNLPISTNATALTQIIAVSGSTKIYICSLNLSAPGATAFSLVRGTGTNCATGSPTAVMGSTTAANGMSFGATGGLTYGNGAGTVGSSNASDELCTLQSNAVQVAGNLTYVQQ